MDGKFEQAYNLIKEGKQDSKTETLTEAVKLGPLKKTFSTWSDSVFRELQKIRDKNPKGEKQFLVDHWSDFFGTLIDAIGQEDSSVRDAILETMKKGLKAHGY